MSELNFIDIGEGLPVVLLHGFCESNIVWNDLSQRLSSDYRILCPDLPGFGKSPLPEKKEFELDDIATILFEWLETLDIDKVVMIGHSLGGYVTLAFADTYYNKLLGFGLFHSTANEDSADKKATRNKAIDFLETHGASEFTDTFIPGLFYHRHKEVEKDIEVLVQDARSCTNESLIAYIKAMRDRPDRRKLLENNLPILFIAGEKDTAVPLESSKAQMDLLDPKYAHTLPETGHMGMFERKNETIRIVSDYLSQFR